MRGVFVTGTDTGVGKSVVAAAICAALSHRGERVAAFKPAVTGLAEPPGIWGPDHELLAAASGQRPDTVTPHAFAPPVSPHLAAELESSPIEPAELVAAARAAGARADVLVCEGVGGLLVPLTPEYAVRDLAIDLGLPLVVAARPGLGTINHTLLTIEAARSAGLVVGGIVMTPWPDQPDEVAVSNLDTVERLAEVPVSGLPATSPQGLASAGAGLPLAGWVGARHNGRP
jgi:dethiobiotin synthetase